MQNISEGLQSAHELNESHRTKSALAQLKEEDVASLVYVTDDHSPLPTRFGLGPYVVIDFPGINDAGE